MMVHPTHPSVDTMVSLVGHHVMAAAARVSSFVGKPPGKPPGNGRLLSQPGSSYPGRHSLHTSDEISQEAQ
jgi:hypothetical protein